VTLLAFAADRRAAAAPFLLRAGRAAIDRYLLSAVPTGQSSKPAARCSRHGRTDGRTDTVPLDRPWRILCEQCQEQYSAIMRLWSPAAKAFLMHRLYWFTVDNGAGQPATLFVFGP